jgi:hypothetical protein
MFKVPQFHLNQPTLIEVNRSGRTSMIIVIGKNIFLLAMKTAGTARPIGLVSRYSIFRNSRRMGLGGHGSAVPLRTEFIS